MSKTLIKSVKHTFKTKFNSKSINIFSPGRINLIGEHTDYNDGFAFPAAINKGIALSIYKTEQEKSCVFAIDVNESHTFSHCNIKPIDNGGWKNYILGVVAELQATGKVIGNFNAVFSGNIPSGSGMSSSAALENAFVYGLNKLFNLGLSKHEMILISQKAEHHYAGVMCGIMDQYASMFGVKKSALLLDCRTVSSEILKINFKNYKLVLINSNVKHDLSESAYNDRRAVCEKVSQLLSKKALRDATVSDLETIKSKITEQDFQKALYVINENQRVLNFKNAINQNDMHALGNLLFQSHHGLSQHYKVSCKELDFLVEQAKKDEAVIGSRMMGGGFGGCTINLVKKEGVKAFKAKVRVAFKSTFNRTCSIYQIKLSEGTRVIE